MPGVSDEQIARAREWDLLSYLQHHQASDLTYKSGEYRLKTDPGLVISNGMWCHFNQNDVGGVSALDYLVKCAGVHFVEAVTLLNEGGPVPVVRQPVVKEKKPFKLPEVNRYASRAVAYLQKRGIDAEILGRCIEDGLLYESKRYHNCVFVGRDKAGSPRFACVRSTTGNVKMDVAGSDKRFGFCLQAAGTPSRIVAVFESPIDALSYATLKKRFDMAPQAWDRFNYLSLGGTSPRALLQYLRDHPEADHVYLYIDNDLAGQQAEQRIRQAIRGDAKLDGQVRMITYEPPPPEYGKDYNELLQFRFAEMRQPQTTQRSVER